MGHRHTNKLAVAMATTIACFVVLLLQAYATCRSMIPAESTLLNVSCEGGMHIEYRDGDEYIINDDVSNFIKKLPTLGRWETFLKMRGANTTSYPLRKHDIPHIGRMAMVVSVQRRLSTVQEQVANVENGEVVVQCLSCGLKQPMMQMQHINVGTLVKVNDVTRLGYDSKRGIAQYAQTMVARPVQKGGLGCMACVPLFDAAVAQVNAAFAEDMRIYKLKAELAELVGHGMPMKVPEPRIPWIDVGATVREMGVERHESKDSKAESWAEWRAKRVQMRKNG